MSSTDIAQNVDAQNYCLEKQPPFPTFYHNSSFPRTSSSNDFPHLIETLNGSTTTTTTTTHYQRTNSAPNPRCLSSTSNEKESKVRNCGDSSGYIDLRSIIDSMERFDSDEEKQPVPEGVVQLISRQCQEHQVKFPVWAQSTKDWREIVILGRGVTKIKEPLVKEAKALYPMFKFVTEESGPLHTYQFGELCVVQRRADEQTEGWIDSARAKCSLILSADDKQSCEPDTQKEFAVATAHSLLHGSQCDELIQTTDSQVVDSVRKRVNSRAQTTDYILEIADQNQPRRFNLTSQVLFAYRHYSKKISTTTNHESYRCNAGKCSASQMNCCPHMFMNDISVLPISSEKVEQLLDEIGGDTSFHFDGIATANADFIADLIEKKVKVFVYGFACQLVANFKSLDETDERIYADHITFVPRESLQLDKGDSGSILYLRYQDRHFAFGMVIGSIGKVAQISYQAILLQPALKEIEMDYSHLVANFRPYNMRRRYRVGLSANAVSA